MPRRRPMRRRPMHSDHAQCPVTPPAAPRLPASPGHFARAPSHGGRERFLVLRHRRAAIGHGVAATSRGDRAEEPARRRTTALGLLGAGGTKKTGFEQYNRTNLRITLSSTVENRDLKTSTCHPSPSPGNNPLPPVQSTVQSTLHRTTDTCRPNPDTRIITQVPLAKQCSKPKGSETPFAAQLNSSTGI